MRDTPRQTEDHRPKCSIVIRAYNEEKHIGRLLTGIMQQSLQDFEIILVDSGSTDATVAIASRYPVQVVHIRPEDFTFGRSLNLGISHAQGEFIVIASAHVYPVYPDWLEKLLAPFDEPQIAMTYGKQRGNSTTKFSERQLMRQWFPDQSQRKQAHPFCNNANDAVRRVLWEQRPYDDTLTGLEDLDWAHWAMNQGHAISYAAEAEIVHVHEEGPRKVLNRFRREAMAFKRIFPEERFNLWNLIALYTTNVVNDLLQALRQRRMLSNFGSILWYRFMQFYGTYLGYRHSGALPAQLKQVFYYPPGLSSKRAPTRAIQPIEYGKEGEIGDGD